MTQTELSPADIARNLAGIRERIARAATAWDRQPDEADLIAVAKTHPVTAVESALLAGQRLFGENRVQEAQAKYPQLRESWPDMRVHLIGPLQSNKASDAIACFDAIQTVDREKLARALADEMARQGRRPDCYIQINTGEEPQKAGIAPADADAFIALCRDELKLPVVGLMCIPPVDAHPAPHFALLREIARRNALSQLSMGMSGDFEAAISFGATCVRVGSAIFGERPPLSAA